MPAQALVASRRRRIGTVVAHNRTEIQEAVDRVYKRYGNNLSAFYRDVKKSILAEETKEEGKKKIK